MARRLKILVNSYTLSPYLGSESAVAWNHIRNLAQWCDIVVIYGASGGNMGTNIDIPKWLNTNFISGVRFEFVVPSRISMLLTKLNSKGLIYAHFLAFKLWQKKAYIRALELLQDEDFDLIHHLGPIGYREPGYLWKIDKPYVWGPIGGFNNAPWSLYKALPLSGKLKQLIRSITNNYQMRYDRRVCKALKRANLVLASTTECVDKIFQLHGIQARYIPENCIDCPISLNIEKFLTKKYRFIFIGSLNSNKAVQIQLLSLVKLKQRKDWVFDIVGNGPMRSTLEKIVLENNLENHVKFHGSLSRSEVQIVLDDAHLNLVTSVSEGNPTVIWEAMSHGVPTLTLDHCGMHDIINENNGIKITIGKLSQIIDDVANRILELLNNPDLFYELALGTIREASKYTLNKRLSIIQTFYQQAVDNYKLSKNN